MDTALSETQTLLRDSIRDYLKNEVPFNRIRELEKDGGWDQDLWGYLQSAGFLGLPFPESLGGDGGELSDLGVLLEELTRRAVVIPFLETMASAIALQRHGDAAVAREVVEGVIRGTTTLSPAILEATDRYGEVAVEVRNGTVSGEKRWVDYGQHVTHHLVAAREGGEVGLYLVDANAPEVSVRPLKNMGRTPQCHVTYAAAPARKAGGEAAFRFLIDLARALASIECLGNSQQALDATVEYVGMRVQFGRPIGTFQAVQHHTANMATMVLSTRFLANEALWKLDQGTATSREVAAAKAWASRTATEVPMMAHQLHGGIGFTEEYDLHFFSRRGKQRAVAWGTADECLAIMAESIEEAERWL
jgi:alkylation response protein AidB-like acyl-CoA dehydrogenase